MRKQKFFNYFLSSFILIILLILSSCSNSNSDNTYYQLAITEEPMDSGEVLPGEGKFEVDTIISLEINPENNWNFSHWEGKNQADVYFDNNIWKIKINEDKQLTAIFTEQIQEKIVEPYFDPIPDEYLEKESISVEIFCEEENTEIYYTLDGSEPGPENGALYIGVITLEEDTLLKAVAYKAGMESSSIVKGWYYLETEPNFQLNTSSQGDGTGSIKIEPQKEYYNFGEEVILTAIPEQGSVFTGWEGAEIESTTENPLELNIQDNLDIVGNFSIAEFTIECNTAEGDGYAFPSPYSQAYSFNEEVTITAHPNQGWEFSHWQGDLEGTPNPVEIVVTDDILVEPVFVPKKYTLDIHKIGEGTVTIDPLKDYYSYQEKVTIQAEPDEEWNFVGWKNIIGETFSKQQTVEITHDSTIEAHFSDSYRIQDFINLAQDGDEIIVPSGTYYEELIIENKNIILSGEDPKNPATTIIDGSNNEGSVITLNSGLADAEIVIKGFTIRGGNTDTGSGGGIQINTQATITDNIIEDNSASKGGGLSISGSSNNQPMIKNNIIRNNNSTNGGGIYMEIASPIIKANTISDNTASSRGGGLYSNSNLVSPQIQDNKFENNQAENYYGGGIYIGFAEQEWVINGNDICNNLARSGGGVFIKNSDFTSLEIKDNTILDNQSELAGGGVNILSSENVIFDDNTVNSNQATSFGGGISTTNITNSVFINNVIKNNWLTEEDSTGGGLTFRKSDDSNEIIGNIFGENEAHRGAGIYLLENSPVLYSNTFENNTASYRGGALFLENAEPVDENGEILQVPDDENVYENNEPDDVYYMP